MEKLIKKLEELHSGYTVEEIQFFPPLEHPMPNEWWDEIVEAIDGVEPTEIWKLI